jgi:hypothetical protein
MFDLNVIPSQLYHDKFPPKAAYIVRDSVVAIPDRGVRWKETISPSRGNQN